MQLTTWYNPRQISGDELKPRAIVHQRILDRLVNDLCLSEMTYPEQHYLVVGEWGMGKTTLLLQMYHKIQATNNCRAPLLPILFNENEPRIQTLSDLWVRTAALLSEEDDYFEACFEYLSNLLSSGLEVDQIERLQFEHLQACIQKSDQKIILLIDNVEKIIKKFSLHEKHRLRKLLLIAPEIRIVGSADDDIDFAYDYKDPFYGFFKIERLKPLTEEEAFHLLLELGKWTKDSQFIAFIKRSKHRIESFRQMTGGNLRMMWLLFEQFVQDQKEDMFEVLQRVTGQLRPYMQGSIKALSNQQQAILETLALEWKPTGVQSLSQKLRAKSKTISAQLNQLRQIGQVEKLPTNTKNFKYRLKDRILNLALVLINGSQEDQQQVKKLYQSLETWQQYKGEVAEMVKQITERKSTPKRNARLQKPKGNTPYQRYQNALAGKEYAQAITCLLTAIDQGLLRDKASIKQIDIPNIYLIFIWLLASGDYRILQKELEAFERANGSTPLPYLTASLSTPDPSHIELEGEHMTSELGEWESMMKEVMQLAGQLRSVLQATSKH